MEHIKQLDKYIQEIIRTIPDVIRGIEIVDIEQKSGERDLVTEVDKGVEEFLKEKILEKFPDHEVLGEETYDVDAQYDTKNLWVIDPIDGTANFVKQRNDFCTIISYFEDGEPMLTYIYEVTKDDLYHGMKDKGIFLNGEKLPKIENKSLFESMISTDIRRMYLHMPKLFEKIIKESFATRSVGTSGLEGSRVVSGRLGGYINYYGGPWDYSPFFLFSKEMGLVFKTLEGKNLEINSGYSNFILCTEKVYKELIENEK